MTKIYRTTDNNYVALVAHDHDLEDEESSYYGAFEYSIGQDGRSGDWELFIFDLAAEESLAVDSLTGIDNEVVSELVKASRGEVEYEDLNLMGTDYYARWDRIVKTLEDDVLMKAIAAEYAEKVEGRDMVKVYKDDGGYMALVAHGSDNPLRRGLFTLTGLLHYCVDSERDIGSLEIFDGATDTFYQIDYEWDGVDWDVFEDLLDEEVVGIAPDEEYYSTIELYDSVMENELVREALS